MTNALLLTIDFETTGYADAGQSSCFIKTTSLLLDWLKEKKISATFFCVGNILREYPGLLQSIVQQGHEVGCHGWQHTPLEKLGVDEFKKDLHAFLECAHKLQLGSIQGYRAPFFSLTGETLWAINILKEFGFIYDSSAIPANTILYGFPSLRQEPFRFENGLIEMPITVWRPAGRLINAGLPVFGGTYLRLLPSALIRHLLQSHGKPNCPIVGYFHPYDIDPSLEKISSFANNWLYNFLLTLGRKNMGSKLDMLVRDQQTYTMRQWIETRHESIL
jgi:polysaccharide deacetylase family protein (PEP-CTERM system associated)